MTILKKSKKSWVEHILKGGMPSATNYGVKNRMVKRKKKDKSKNVE